MSMVNINDFFRKDKKRQTKKLFPILPGNFREYLKNSILSTLTFRFVNWNVHKEVSFHL